MQSWTRRAFLATTAGAAVAADSQRPPVIDIHQHTPYSGRTADELVEHQRALGIAKTVLLPAGRRYGLAANAGGNETVFELAARYPEEYVCFANEVPTLPEARRVIERYLKQGAVGIGEQKFPVECDSPHILEIAAVARDYDVPVLLHFQHGAYNMGIERFYKVLEKFRDVNFIGHAQTWWGNIDRNHHQQVMYPEGPVTPGGISDRYLSEYPNMFGDLSAGSGRNALQRDIDHARAFLERHQDKLLFGSDCSDAEAHGPKCIGSDTLALLGELAPDRKVLAKILSGNARRIMRIELPAPSSGE